MSDWTVKIKYRNADMETIVEKEYEFIDYVDMLDLGLKGILVDVENAFYALQDNKAKEDWSQDAKARYSTIRHKLLDKANAVKRLPQTLRYKNTCPSTISLSEMIAKQIHKEE